MIPSDLGYVALFIWMADDSRPSLDSAFLRWTVIPGAFQPNGPRFPDNTWVRT